MKLLVFLCALSVASISCAADQAAPKPQGESTKYPGTLYSKTMPDKNDQTASKYTWYKEMSSGLYVGFLNVEYWNHSLDQSKLSRRMSLGEYPGSTSE